MLVYLKNTVKILLEFRYLCDISSVLTPILPLKYHFEGKNMLYEIVQNSTWSNGRIKKSILWPYSDRVLVRFSIKWVFQMLWLFDSPFKHVIYIFHFWLWNSWFFTFPFFLIFFSGLCFEAWIEAGQNIVSTSLFPLKLKKFWKPCFRIFFSVKRPYFRSHRDSFSLISKVVPSHRVNSCK